MSSYSELIKNFEKIRAYMRDFYVYGFKGRDDFKGSSRSYDDERRRLESWLGDHMSFTRTPEGKRVFISIDSRVIAHNPLYKAWKAKSFTDGDITLHFILFDILSDPSQRFTHSELLDLIDNKYLSGFEDPMIFDESTVRKKLKEFVDVGIITAEKEGRRVYYRRNADVDITELDDVLNLFSEIAPCGVVGSFILDKNFHGESPFAFKHHYITSAIDSGVLASLFLAMREGRYVTAVNLSRRRESSTRIRILPLRVFISVQSGREHLLAYHPSCKAICAYRIDYLSDVKIEEPEPEFPIKREILDKLQSKMWGVNPKRGDDHLEHVEFTIKVGDGEDYIVRRLYRERRVGTVEKLDENRYRFFADVYDSNELIPWIRTFICRITQISFSDHTLEDGFKKDLDAMYKMYGLTAGEVDK